MKRTVIQAGDGDPVDLVVYCHIDPSAVAPRVRQVTPDAVFVELWGNGTSAYKPLLDAYGGSWDSYVRGASAKLSKRVGRTCLTTWSAGSQVAKDALRVMLDAGQLGGEGRFSGRLDALVMLDGLYGGKPPGSKPGDGKVAVDPGLRAVALYALAAARGECVFALLHSAIPTTYASSGECARWVRQYVEAEMGVEMVPDASLTPADLDGHRFSEALVLGDFHLLSFPGAGAKEHIAEAHLYDEVWRRWVPWLSETSAPDPVPDTAPAEGLGALALRLSLAELEAGVRETPPGSNRVKGDYWAGCSRVVAGQEKLLKMDVGPWCAAGFQWATYEAARRLGYLAGRDQTSGWRSGPVPHGRRVSVVEIQQDMTLRGLFRPAAVVRSGAFKPEPGDAVFLDRPGGPGGGWGHIARFLRDCGDGVHYEAVGANEAPGPDASRDDLADRWRVTRRRYDDKLLRGFGSFSAEPKDAPGAAKALPESVLAALETSCREWCGRPRPELAEG